jgi:uncharacterized OsmC-like protein
VADCFILTFRAIAKASRLDWTSLVCDTSGTVDRTNGTARFTTVQVQARLVVPVDTDRAKAESLLQKTKRSCLVSNSLNADMTFKVDVAIELAA